MSNLEYVRQKTHPRELAAFVVANKDEKILGINTKLKHDSLGLEAIARWLSGENIHIKHMVMSEQETDNTWLVNAVLDTSTSNVERAGLEAFLKRLDCVEQLNITDYGRVLHQTSLFPIMNRSERVIFQSVSRLQYIRNQLERILTPSGVAVIYYNMGMEGGKGTHKMFLQQFQADLLTPKQRMDLFRDHMISGGLGIFDFTDLDLEGHSGLVKVFDDYECEGIDEKTTKQHPICHNARGMLAGFLSSEWSTERVKVVELKCRGMGDPHCELGVAVDEQ